jgi:Putative Flp pilus-assembly TadE/G-like
MKTRAELRKVSAPAGDVMKSTTSRNQETGQSLYIAAASLVVLVGFLGLGIDMGALRYEKRLQQTAADAAAIAGANNLAFGSGITVGAQNASAANGFTNTAEAISNCGASAAIGTVCVQINNPPASGPHGCNGGTCDGGYVEALVSAVHPTYFMKIFGVTKETVTARAVATNISDDNGGCLYLLGPTSGFTGNGGGNKGGLIAPTCGIVDNGSFRTNGPFPVCAGSIGVAGSGTGGGGLGSCSVSDPGSGVTCSDQSVSTCPAPIPAAANPLTLLTIPTQPSPAPCSGNCFNPGTYTSQIKVTGNGSYVFNPGIYALDGGGFVCHGTPTIRGTGVMFYLKNGATFDCSGNSSVGLTAPTASNCPACPSWSDGILIYQDPKTDQNADTLSGGGNSNPDEGYNGLVVIWGLTMNGNDRAILGGNAGFGGSVVKNAILVE